MEGLGSCALKLPQHRLWWDKDREEDTRWRQRGQMKRPCLLSQDAGTSPERIPCTCCCMCECHIEGAIRAWQPRTVQGDLHAAMS